jgi:hypothetical protein
MAGETDSGLPFMTQNLAPLCPIEGLGSRCPMPSVDGQKKVFAQMVAAIWSLHAADVAHNDLHGQNIVLSTDTSPPHVALVDLGDVTTLEKAYKDDYKRDANAFWKFGALLAACNADAQWTNDKYLMRHRKPKFLECLNQKWNADPDFILALSKVIDGNIQKSTEQHVEGLFNTKFVQANMPKVQSVYPWPGTKECGGCRSWSEKLWEEKFNKDMYSEFYKCDSLPTANKCRNQKSACFWLKHPAPWMCSPPDEWHCTKIGSPKYDGRCLTESHDMYHYAKNWGDKPDSKVKCPSSWWFW